MIFPDLRCAGCETYRDLAEAGELNPCAGCPLYENLGGMHPVTRWAIDLYWLPFGSPEGRLRWESTTLRLPRWKAEYLLDVWEIYGRIRRRCLAEREATERA